MLRIQEKLDVCALTSPNRISDTLHGGEKHGGCVITAMVLLIADLPVTVASRATELLTLLLAEIAVGVIHHAYHLES